MTFSPVRLSFLIAKLCLAIVVFVSIEARADKPARPNIILIMSDDMGYSDLGCYGGEIKTPNLDRLATEGLRFRQFYNNAKCTTTRASLITGLYPRPRGKLLKPNMVTIPEVLKKAGYRTALSGKWHLGNSAPTRPSDRGFDRYFGLLDGCCNFFDPSIPDPKFKGNRVRWVAEDDERITEFPDDFYMTDAISEYACHSIRDFAATDDPFFLHVCYTAPHYPLHAKPEDIAKYADRYTAGWEALRQERFRRQIELGIAEKDWTLPEPNREVGDWETAPNRDWQILRMAVYAAMVDSMDQGIGEILNTLTETGEADNTLVLFLTDNGGCAETPGGNNPAQVPGPKEFYSHCGPGWAYAQNTPFRRYKSWCHEGGICTPLIAHWPGRIKANTMTDRVGHIIDFLPTFAELAGIDDPTAGDPAGTGIEPLPIEGQSLLKTLDGSETEADRVLFWEWSGSRAIRDGDWKLVYDKKTKGWELYNLAEDRTETVDLAEQYPERVADLSARWNHWAVRTGHRRGSKN